MANFRLPENLYRKSLQVIILVLLGYMVVRIFVDPSYFADFEAYCPFGGMQALSSFIVTNTLACSMTEAQIFMGIALIIGVILVSKLFCSYICPIGTFTEWLGKIGDRFKVRFTITGIADRLLRVLKYGLLFITFYFSVKTSELFCKEYDPFYAIFTWFGHDVHVWYATIAIVVMILGAVFIRQFWCKYLCPLSAASNIFSNAIMFAGVLLIYLAVRGAGLDIDWVWLLAAICLGGLILEVGRMEGWYLPPIKVTRDKNLCTDCKECDASCPMAIEISQYEKVSHIDCHLCGDCVYACPEKNVLQINKKEVRWLPASATVILVAIALYLASTVELPTINLRWGSEQQISTASVFSQSGLKNVKCFGSASSFASRMRRVPGVLGVEAYVQSNTVKVLYDPEQLDEQDVKSSIFSPAKTLLSVPGKDVNLQKIELAIDKLFDSYDTYYLTQLLRQTDGVYGFLTRFGEPVHADVFIDASKLTHEDVKAVIESPDVTYVNRGKSYTKPLRFEVESMSDEMIPVAKEEFMKTIFSPYNLEFNDYKTYSVDRLNIYQVAMPQAMNTGLKRQFQFLAAHLSMDSAIVRFQTAFDEKPLAKVYFVGDMTDEAEIYSALKADTLTFMYSNGKTGKVRNIFKFPGKAEVLALEEK